jgi:hypothetical protein
MPWAGHLIRSGRVAELSCRRAIETIISAGGNSRDRGDTAAQPGDPVMSDVLFVSLTVAFFVLAVAFAWFCEKLR